MPITAVLGPWYSPLSSTRMPASLAPIRSHQHVVGPLQPHALDAQRLAAPATSATPTASDSPDSAANPRSKRFRHDRYMFRPGGDSQARPRRPRPACWVSASTMLPSGSPDGATLAFAGGRVQRPVHLERPGRGWQWRRSSPRRAAAPATAGDTRRRAGPRPAGPARAAARPASTPRRGSGPAASARSAPGHGRAFGQRASSSRAAISKRLRRAAGMRHCVAEPGSMAAHGNDARNGMRLDITSLARGR